MIAADERPIAAALFRRAEDGARPGPRRTLRLSVRETPEVSHGVRPPKVADVRPEPNAPLLMRIVRTPYALAPVAFVRIEADVLLGAAKSVPRVSFDRPGRPFAALLGEIRSGAGAAAPERPRPRFVPRRSTGGAHRE